ncbi:MAG: di-trans,poly-cis-decaprenylcistransferase [Beijerinckiaceae bacterium]
MATNAFETTDGLHVAIIMDGNGRWAQRRGLPRSAGHKAGVEAARRIVEAAADLGVGTLTLFAFSADNWQRPAEEVGTLMQLLQVYLRNEQKRLIESKTRLTVIGRRDRLPKHMGKAIAKIEAATNCGTTLHLRIALDYSSRETIARAAARWPAEEAISREAFRRLLALQGDRTESEVDLLIRSGGEKRLSDFLLWECAYAELCFLDVMWPDFTAEDFAAAIADFRHRERRFGGLGKGLGKLPNLTAAE